MSLRSWQANAAARAAGQGRLRRREAVALTGEHDAALSPPIETLDKHHGRSPAFAEDDELQKFRDQENLT